MKYLVFLGGTVLAIMLGVGAIFANYHYTHDIAGYWSLSVKASTLPMKAQYLDQFVTAIEGAKLSGNDAIWLATPDNSYEQNLQALKSLQGRMHDTQKMDVQSFAYQTAIQQITAQEQDEAGHMLDTFEGIWYLKHYPWLWDWIGGTLLVLAILGCVGGGIVCAATADFY